MWFIPATVSVEVLEKGFRYQEQVYRSLSAVARQVSGVQRNGTWGDVMSRERRRPGEEQEPQASPFRCAIYTRKSTEEGLTQEFNTLEAQRESAEAYVQSPVDAGWTALAERYDDGGYTGASLERPALCKLLVDIEAGWWTR